MLQGNLKRPEIALSCGVNSEFSATWSYKKKSLLLPDSITTSFPNENNLDDPEFWLTTQVKELLYTKDLKHLKRTLLCPQVYRLTMFMLNRAFTYTVPASSQGG